MKPYEELLPYKGNLKAINKLEPKQQTNLLQVTAKVLLDEDFPKERSRELLNLALDIRVYIRSIFKY